jgi:GNAT superfamily N-acetyltransferase
MTDHPLPHPPPAVRRLQAPSAGDLRQLADVLVDCVEGGASVSFMSPLSVDRALAFWQGVAAGVANGDHVLLVAEDLAGICGTVQLVVGQPENQPHRADVSKMLVHRRARRRGLGAALMQALEAQAQALGKTLLVLDTASAEAERLYERQGWVRCGHIPGFALLPAGGLCATTLYYRQLAPATALEAQSPKSSGRPT